MLHLPKGRKRRKTASAVVVPLLVTLFLASSFIYLYFSFLSSDKHNLLAYAKTSNCGRTSTTPQELPGIKIISPTKNQQIPIGNSDNNNILSVKGVSTSNINSHCEVYVIVNAIKPYQKTELEGQKGHDDYSTWKYHLNNEYATIKPGSNKLTSKIFCASNPTNVSKFYSVNFTGVSVPTVAPSLSKQLQPQLIKTTSVSNNSYKNNNNISQNNDNNSDGASLPLPSQRPAVISQKDITTAIQTAKDSGNKSYSSYNNSGTISEPKVKIISPAKGQQILAGK
jgi:hypothetical protein